MNVINLQFGVIKSKHSDNIDIKRSFCNPSFILAMTSSLFRLVFVSAFLCVVFCDSPEIRIVKNLITTSNRVFRECNKTEIPLPDAGWVFEPIRYRNGRLGKFDTLELLPDPQILFCTNHFGTIYNFNLSTSLKDLSVKYNFFVNYPYYGRHGNVTINIGEKSFRLEGRVLLEHDESCFAVIQDAKVDKFGDFKVEFEPDDALLITYIYQDVLNFVHQQLAPLINRSIRSEITKTIFGERFDKYVCEEVTRTMTT